MSCFVEIAGKKLDPLMILCVTPLIGSIGFVYHLIVMSAI